MVSGDFPKKIWTSSFFVIVWDLWKERNERIFEEGQHSIKEISELILLRLGWWLKAWCDDFPYSPQNICCNPDLIKWKSGRKAVAVTAKSKDDRWMPPTAGRIKWNVDASRSGEEGIAAIGGVLRDGEGNFKCIFSSRVGVVEIISAEVLAIKRALELSNEKGWVFLKSRL